MLFLVREIGEKYLKSNATRKEMFKKKLGLLHLQTGESTLGTNMYMHFNTLYVVP